MGEVPRSCNDGLSSYSLDITGFIPNMLVTGRETNMPMDLIYGSVEQIIIINIIVLMLKSFEIRWLMHISEPGNIWATQLSDSKHTMTAILHLISLRQETGSFIDIN